MRFSRNAGKRRQGNGRSVFGISVAVLLRGQEQYGTECCRFMAAMSGKGWGEAGRSEFLYEMRIFVPVFVINPFFLSVEVELIHAKDDRDVFGLPELPVGVTVFHT